MVLRRGEGRLRLHHLGEVPLEVAAMMKLPAAPACLDVFCGRRSKLALSLWPSRQHCRQGEGREGKGREGERERRGEEGGGGMYM